MKTPTHSILAMATSLCICLNVKGQVDSALSLQGINNSIRVANSQSISTPEFSLSLWFSSANTSTNGEQVIVSKKRYSNLSDFSNQANWQIFDATYKTESADVKGFVGAAFDGRYIYCSPWWKGGTQSGQILRYDTRQPYSDSDSWSVYNAENKDGVGDIRGLEGTVYDGTFVYFVPLHRDGRYFAKVLRYDTRRDFSDPLSWEVFDAESLDPDETMRGFVGAVFDGTHIYFVPNPFSPHSKVLRFNTKHGFHDRQSWSIFDLRSLPNYLSNNGFFGGIFDGRYIYLVPYNQFGTVVRFDTFANFFSEQSWSKVDFNFLLRGRVHGTFTGAAFDGRFIYFSPAYGGGVVRYDTERDFFTASSWEIANVLNLDGQFDIHGGVGPAYDGRFVYFPPMYGKEGRSGKFIVYDTQADFTSLSSWNYIDLSQTDSLLRGFEGAIYDGEYIYFLPMNFENAHGKIPRYRSVQQFAYELKFNNSSSSFGSTPGNITVNIGTSLGVRSIFAKGLRAELSDEQWHHLAVTYDGFFVKLYLDGILNTQQDFKEYAAITQTDADLVIGNSSGSLTNGFQGKMNDLALWGSALSDSEIQGLLFKRPIKDDARLVGFWSFDAGKKFNAVLDSSQNSNHGIRSSSIHFVPSVIAGQDLTVCLWDSTFTLDGFYPVGGLWSGNGADETGRFNPQTAGEGTHILTYNIAKDMAGGTKIFSGNRKVTVLGSTVERPVISQPGFFTLEASAIASSYSWARNDTLLHERTKKIGTRHPGIYKVRGTDAAGCVTEFSEEFELRLPLAAEITQIGFQTLQATGTGSSFAWFKNDTLLQETSGTLKIISDGNYSVRNIDTFGDQSPLSQSLRASLPVIPNIERRNLFSLGTGLSGARYFWYRNDSLLNVDSASVVALLPGNYTVQVMDSIGTLSSLSSVFHNEDYWVTSENELGDDYELFMEAGRDEKACPTGDSIHLKDFFPLGGRWSGSNVSPDGVFTPSLESAGTTKILTYTITKTFGDISRTYSRSKKVFIEKIPTVTASSLVICNDDEVTLQASDGFLQYAWTTGDTTKTIEVSSPGEYSVKGTNDSECTVSSPAIFLSAEALSAPQLHFEDLSLLRASADVGNQDGYKFVWMRNDTLLEEQTSLLSLVRTGHYKSRVVSGSGCVSPYSRPVFFEHIVDLTDDILVFPNPASEFIKVGLFKETHWVKITVSSRRGRQILTRSAQLRGKKAILEIDVSNLQENLYIINVETDFGVVSKKLLILR